MNSHFHIIYENDFPPPEMAEDADVLGDLVHGGRLAIPVHQKPGQIDCVLGGKTFGHLLLSCLSFSKKFIFRYV